MSAIVVQDKTINIIVSFLYSETYSSNGTTYGEIGRILKKAGYDLAKDWTDTELAENLFDLNCEAVNQRYKDKPARTQFHPEAFKHQMFLWDNNPLTAYKSLQCLIYQCSEGNIPDTSLYKMLVSIKHCLADCIVSNLPEYKTLEWE
jgi:hypothetical protein